MRDDGGQGGFPDSLTTGFAKQSFLVKEKFSLYFFQLETPEVEFFVEEFNLFRRLEDFKRRISFVF